MIERTARIRSTMTSLALLGGLYFGAAGIAVAQSAAPASDAGSYRVLRGPGGSKILSGSGPPGYSTVRNGNNGTCIERRQVRSLGKYSPAMILWNLPVTYSLLVALLQPGRQLLSRPAEAAVAHEHELVARL